MAWKRWLGRGIAAVVALVVLGFAVGSLGGSDADAPAFDRTAMMLQGRSGDLDPQLTNTGAMVATGPVREAAALPNAAPADSFDDGFDDRIIRTATLAVEVREGLFDRAWGAVTDIAARLGGDVMSSNRGGDDVVPLGKDGRRDEPLTGTITIRVPTSALDQALDDLRGLGTVVSERSSSQDVTEEFVDLRSRLRNLRGEQNVLLALFDRANSIKDTLAVQRRLSDVQGQIEQVQGRLNFLEARTDFASITVNMAEPGAAISPFVEPEPNPSFAKAWDTAVEGLVRIGSTAMIAGIWLAPFAVLTLLGIAAWRRVKPAPTV